MPDRRRHRGAHPRDRELFAPERIEDLRRAVGDLSWLLSRGYAPTSSLKIVGDRYDLAQRQRTAVARAACADAALAGRTARRDEPGAAAAAVIIDGYNLLITIESALAGGVILGGRDGTYRDLASIHGSYRRMTETLPALELIGEALDRLGTTDVLWLLDAPVSNSGRLRSQMLAHARQCGRSWRIELDVNPDRTLIAADALVVSSDSVVLDGCRRWLNLARLIVDRDIRQAWVVDLSGRGGSNRPS
ncbi:MAG: DUF434 domain-containing protein [Planctomycetes bacterium]|nr:DUF434 domain-containing protein [Planctomycetota bacterium]